MADFGIKCLLDCSIIEIIEPESSAACMNDISKMASARTKTLLTWPSWGWQSRWRIQNDMNDIFVLKKLILTFTELASEELARWRTLGG